MRNNELFKLLLLIITFSANISCRTQRTRVDITGNWQVTISVSEGTVTGKASLSQRGEMVSGWVGPGENDPIPVTGTLNKGKLVLKTLPQPGRTVAFDIVELKIVADSMYGVVENGSHGKGSIKFTRTK
jgi:hypothetical protein